MARYRRIAVRTVDLTEFKPVPKVHPETPRQRAIRERDEEIVAAFNEAATLPASKAVAIDLKPDQKLATLRAAVKRLMNAEGRDLNFAVRGTTIVISKGSIPGGRSARRSAPAGR